MIPVNRSSDRPVKPVRGERASLLLSTAAGMKGWFYAWQIQAEVGEAIWLSQLPGSPLDGKREWSKIFCFKWVG
jgi:hypothetical protein